MQGTLLAKQIVDGIEKISKYSEQKIYSAREPYNSYMEKSPVLVVRRLYLQSVDRLC